MPIFEFECDICGQTREKIVSHDCNEVECDKSYGDTSINGNHPMGCIGICHKIISAPAIVYQRKYQLNGKEWG